LREIFEHIAPLITEVNEDEKAKQFDALMYDLQIQVYHENKKQVNLISKVTNAASKLTKKASIPAVGNKLETLKQVISKDFWSNINVIGIERLRIELRDLMKFLDKNQVSIIYTSFEDTFSGESKEHKLVKQNLDLDVYRSRLEQYIKENSTHITIHKIRNNQPITQLELKELEKMLFEQGDIGSKEQFEEAYGKEPVVLFIRKILGMNIAAAKQAFSEILEDVSLNSQQISFINSIINYISINGIIEADKLFESPFTDINSKGVLGLFDNEKSHKIISIIEKINSNTEVV
jgi:type I restriction enzyme R subunit